MVFKARKKDKKQQHIVFFRANIQEARQYILIFGEGYFIISQETVFDEKVPFPAIHGTVAVSKSSGEGENGLPSSGQRERIVDLLKGICILLVCFTHYRWDSAEREAFLFAWWVDMAVPVFMILSGYVYGRSCFNKNLTALSHAYAPRLLWNKILRLTLPVVLIYAATLIGDFYRYGEISYPIVHTFLQGGQGPGAYYYPVMMQIVFTLPLIHRVVTRYEEKGLLLCLLANAAYEVLHVVYLVPVESHRLLMFRYIFLLAAGCFLSIGKPLKIPYQIGMVLVGVGFNLAYLYGGYEPTYLIHWTTTAFVPAMMIVRPALVT